MSDATCPTFLTQLPEQSNRRQYSRDKLLDYFSRVQLPQEHLDTPILSDAPLARTKEHGLPLLEALCRHHTCHVPFENLLLHYSTDKKVTLDPSELYTWFVKKRRGGRCMENNTFFASVLRSLGYQVRNCGGRVSRAMSPYPEVRQNQAATYDGLNHMLNLVRFDDDEWYVVDVGMGAMGPNLPYPLRHNYEITSIAPRRIRIQHRAITESYASDADAPKMWCFDVCHDPARGTDNKWIPTYCFTETEFLPQDYEVMSWYTSTHSNSFFTRNVTATKMIMDAEQEKIVGSVTLFGDTIRESLGAERKIVRECRTESERVELLEEIYGIKLSKEERDGLASELRLA
jgi:arylamine N-acetyltransferase